MKEARTLLSRRRFLAQTGGLAALAATAGPSRHAFAQEAPHQRIRAVDAYPIHIGPRSEGLLDAPTFDGDDDPRRWRWGGPFEQLPSAIIAVIKTDQGITGFGMGAGGSAAVEIIDGHLKHLLMGANALSVEQLWDQMYSSGVLYGRRDLLEEMDPFLGGGEMISVVTPETSTWAAVPHKFEAGTPNIADVIAFGAALR